MATENFTTYTEVDPNSNVTVTSSNVTWATILSTAEAYVYADKGVDYFGGSFTHYLTVKTISTSTWHSYHPAFWLLSNVVDAYQTFILDRTNDGLAIGSRLTYPDYVFKFYLWEVSGGNAYATSTTALSADTIYYLKIVRNESVGTYGTLYCYIYTDEAKTNLLTTLSLTLHSKQDLRYIFGFNNYLVLPQSNFEFSGYSENLELFATAPPNPPSVTTQATTNIATTTATGNGTIVTTGGDSVTQHGHCWSTSANPTTADSKTTKGAGSVGAYTSAITGMSALTLYHTRAYATNSVGTSYGADVEFTTLPLSFIPRIFIV